MLFFGFQLHPVLPVQTTEVYTSAVKPASKGAVVVLTPDPLSDPDSKTYMPCDDDRAGHRLFSD